MIYKFVSDKDPQDSLEINSDKNDVFFNFLECGEITRNFTLDKKTLHDFIGALLTIQSKMNKK